MAEEIKIVASAVGFDQVNKALDSTTKSLEETSQAATQAGKTLGNQLKVGSGQAQQSILNLSRVVQDAPYGFIGIANNINPLVESFSRLKAESGSTGGALKALLSGLSGPAGLGIAFAVVTSAISFAQMGLSRWGAATAKAKEETDKFKEGLRSAEQGAIAQSIKFQGLISVIQDVTRSERDRNVALEEANKVLEPYGKKIDSLNVSMAESKKLIDFVTEALINQAVGAKLADKIADLTLKKREKANEIAKFEIDNNRLLKITSKELSQAGQGAIGIAQQRADVVDQLNLKIAEQAKIEKDLVNYTNDYKATLKDLPSATKKSTKDTETLSEAIIKFEKSLKAIQATGLSLGTPQFDINNEKIKEFENFLKKIIEKFNVDPKNKIYLGLEAKLNKIKDENFFAAMKASAEKNRKAAVDILGIIPIDNVEIVIPRRNAFQISLDDAYRNGIISELIRLSKKFNFDLPLGALGLNTEGLKLQLDSITKLAEDVPDEFRKTLTKSLRKSGEESNKAWKEYATSLNNAATGFLNDAASNIAIKFGEALGAVFTGGNFGKVFSGVFDLLAQGVQSLGEQLIKIGFLAVIAQQALAQLLANPFAAIGVGVALVALSAALKNLKTNAFAVGTRYAPGGMALVGERGPEMVNLPRGSQVIPAAQTSHMMSGIGSSIEVFGTLRGQDIYFSNKKYGQTYKRTT